jgi:hypothetical protein
MPVQAKKVATIIGSSSPSFGAYILVERVGFTWRSLGFTALDNSASETLLQDVL